MKDITDKLFVYLEAKRHLWNAFFINVFHSLRECSPLDEYEEIDRLLFQALVLKDINKSLFIDKEFKFGDMPFLYLRVIPKKELDMLDVMICDPSDSYRKWEPVDLLLGTDIHFSFIEFFEWDRYGYVSYPYFRVRVMKYDKKPEFVGWDALIKTINARAFFVEEK